MFDVKETVKQEFFDVMFTFRVIGDSHYIEAPEIGVYELFSCKPIPDETAVTVELTTGRTKHVTHDVDGVNISTDIVGKPLAAFSEGDEYDVKYKFGTDAFTTIKCVSENTYNTYHTYPEYNLALYTENTFTATDTKENTDTKQTERKPTIQ
jgi:hypothetical protein